MPPSDRRRSTVLPFEFVIQQHHVQRGVHWDLMLLRPDATHEPSLATWQAAVPPMGINLARPIPLLALADHRRAYLDYEGPISGGRGWCRIFDRGRYGLLIFSPWAWQVRFAGDRLAGIFWLSQRSQPNEWELAKCLPLR